MPLLILTAAGPARSGGLEFLGVYQDGVGGIAGLNGVESVAMSPDGAHIYAAGTEADALAAFSRDPASGALSFIEAYQDGVDGVDGLNQVRAVAVSPDGAHVYAAGYEDDAVVMFRRNLVTGVLTFGQALFDGVGGITSLHGPHGVTVSPDGAHVYVANNRDDAVTVFNRNVGTGMLTLVEEHVLGVGGITSLDGAETVAVSPDGAHVYVAAEDDSTLTVFRRDAATGALTLVEVKQQGVGGMTGLSKVQGVAVSPDGANVYSASGLSDAVVVFSRDAATGALTFVEKQKDGEGGVIGLAGAEWVTVSPNGTFVYATADVDDALVVFSRDVTTGKLTFVERHKDGLDGVEGLEDPESLVVSPDGAHIYVTGDTDDTLAVFSSLCGNSTLDAGEECDDDNLVDGDCCSSVCSFEAAGSSCQDDGNVCTDDQCDGAGACLHVGNTDPCDDGAFCTVGDTCQDSVCQGAEQDCSAAGDQCNDGVCDEQADACVAAPKADGTGCDDGDACTQVDACEAGICVGADPVICTASDQCHEAGVCDPASGACSNPASAGGKVCNDGDACTQADACEAGVCVGADPVVCTASDQCHEAGVCDPASGACSNPASAGGKVCNDGDACTQADACEAGICVGADPVVCTASDQCHEAGVCDPASGACSNPASVDGKVCNDGDACTQVDACEAGICVGADPVICTASDQCHEAGVCDPATGFCSIRERPEENVLSFAAEADTYSDSSERTTNFGTSPILLLDGRPGRRIFMRFNVTGITGLPILSAVVRMQTTSDQNAGSDHGGDMYEVSDNTWDELMLTHDNRPAIEGPLLSSAGAVNPSQTVDFDVTAAVTGDGTYSFGIEAGSDDKAIYDSRGSQTGQPELIVSIPTPCDDGDACTDADICLAGECMGEPVGDADEDGICDAIDVCPTFPDPAQLDEDHNGVGDLCECNQPAPGRCIAGGRSKHRDDCLLEVLPAGPPTLNRKGTKVKRIVQCADGDVACDLDGARDGQCTIGIALCYGNDDPRYPGCRPSMVRTVEVYPRPSGSEGRLKLSNAERIEEAVAALGLEVRRSNVVIQQFTPAAEDITPVCGPLVKLVVPAPTPGRRSAVRKKFSLHAYALDGRRDRDRFYLICK